MFTSFFVRAYRSFSRNFVASMMPLVFPTIFLFLFVGAAGDAGRPSALRIGVLSDSIPPSTADRLVETELVDLDYVSSDYDTQRINARNFDAILGGPESGADLKLFVRPGFVPWAEAVIDRANGQGAGDAIFFSAAIEETEATDNAFIAFLLPGLFVMVLIQLATTSTANIVLSDRMDGTLRLVSSVKGAVVPLFAAEVLFRLVFTMVCFALMLALVTEFAEFDLGGRLVAFIGVYILGALMMIVMGYALGGVIPSRRNWSVLITLVGLASWFFSDILFQASQHEMARPISLILPPTYLTDALRQIATEQPGTFSLGFNLAMITGWLILLTFIVLRFFKFETNDNRM